MDEQTQREMERINRKREGRRRGGEHGRHHGEEHGRHQGRAQTFRRGKAIAFADMLKRQRHMLKQQVEQEEYESIRQVLVGELKATDRMLQEFVDLFEIQDEETRPSGYTKEGGPAHENGQDEPLR